MDVTSSFRLGLWDEKTLLSEGVSSHQGALDLSAAQAFVLFDWFLTFTCDSELISRTSQKPNTGEQADSISSRSITRHINIEALVQIRWIRLLRVYNPKHALDIERKTTQP